MQTIPFLNATHGASRPSLVPQSPQRGADEADCRLALAISAAAFDIAAEEMRAASRRTAPVAEARHVAIYLAHVVFQVTMQAVARAFGRDRSSIGHAVRRIEDRRDDPAFDRRMERLERPARCCRVRDGDATAGEAHR